ncbi:Recombinase [compost metagenome]
MAREKGLICSKNNFYTAIKNPCYCGKITLAKFKDEEARLIQGQHESLISESLFYKVQDILMGRKKQYGTPVVSPEMLPLRGFLKCPKCTRMLTGSASKGRNKYFYYYHCTSSCGCRFRADLVNQSFIDNLKNFIPRPGMIELYKGVIIDQFNNKTKFSKDERRKIVVLIEAQNNRLSKARELLLVNDIDPTDYRLIKKECEEKIIRLEAQLNNLTLDPLHKNDLNLLLEKVALNLSKLDIIYTNSNSEAKRMIIGSIYPEKLTFDGFQHRTTYVNEAISEQEQKLWSLG